LYVFFVFFWGVLGLGLPGRARSTWIGRGRDDQFCCGLSCFDSAGGNLGKKFELVRNLRPYKLFHPTEVESWIASTSTTTSGWTEARGGEWLQQKKISDACSEGTDRIMKNSAICSVIQLFDWGEMKDAEWMVYWWFF